MARMKDDYKEIDTSAGDTAIEVFAALSSAVTWLGGPVSHVLSGITRDRKFKRVEEVVAGLTDDLADFKSTVSEEYVKTDEFEDLLEEGLRRVVLERNGEKRRVYKDFLVRSIKVPGRPYDEQIRFLRTVEQLDLDHIRLIKALRQKPDPASISGMIGSLISTLRRRVPDIPRDRIEELLKHLNDLRLTSITTFHGTMTARGAEDLRHWLTDYGNRFVGFLEK